jgi:hypothetical protein
VYTPLVGPIPRRPSPLHLAAAPCNPRPRGKAAAAVRGAQAAGVPWALLLPGRPAAGVPATRPLPCCLVARARLLLAKRARPGCRASAAVHAPSAHRRRCRPALRAARRRPGGGAAGVQGVCHWRCRAAWPVWMVGNYTLSGSSGTSEAPRFTLMTSSWSPPLPAPDPRLLAPTSVARQASANPKLPRGCPPIPPAPPRPALSAPVRSSACRRPPWWPPRPTLTRSSLPSAPTRPIPRRDAAYGR